MLHKPFLRQLRSHAPHYQFPKDIRFQSGQIKGILFFQFLYLRNSAFVYLTDQIKFSSCSAIREPGLFEYLSDRGYGSVQLFHCYKLQEYTESHYTQANEKKYISLLSQRFHNHTIIHIADNQGGQSNMKHFFVRDKERK